MKRSTARKIITHTRIVRKITHIHNSVSEERVILSCYRYRQVARAMRRLKYKHPIRFEPGWTIDVQISDGLVWGEEPEAVIEITAPNRK